MLIKKIKKERMKEKPMKPRPVKLEAKMEANGEIIDAKSETKKS